MSVVRLSETQISYLRGLNDEKIFFTGAQFGEDYSHDELSGVS